MFLITLLTSLVFAQSSDTKVNNIEFETHEVNATNKGPKDQLIIVNKRPPMPGMIELRQHFHFEMLQSTAEID